MILKRWVVDSYDAAGPPLWHYWTRRGAQRVATRRNKDSRPGSRTWWVSRV